MVQPEAKQAGTSVVGSIVATGFRRPPAAEVAVIGRMDATSISEAVGPMYTMNATVRSLYHPAIPVAGVAFTVKCPAGDNLGVVKALSLVERGDVLVVDAQGFTAWCLGGFQLLRHARDARGLAGIIVNGGYRDVQEAQEAGFPVYAIAVSPYSGPKIGPAEIGVPVCCGGVVVQSGDVIVASAEGIAVVPLAYVSVIAARALASGGPGADGAPDIAGFVARLSAAFDRTVTKEGNHE